MFQDALIESGRAARPRTAAGIPLAIVIHGLGLGALVAASAWLAGDPPEPSVPIFFSSPGGPLGAGTNAIPKPAAARPGERRQTAAPRRFELPAEVPALPAIDTTAPAAEAGDGSETTSGVPGAIGTGEEGGGTGEAFLSDPAIEETPVRVGGSVRAPELLRRIEPVYPEAARKARLEGVVILEAIIGTAGGVEDVRVIRSANALLDSAAAEAVAQWRYRPATLDGRAVRVFLTVTVSFKLH